MNSTRRAVLAGLLGAGLAPSAAGWASAVGQASAAGRSSAAGRASTAGPASAARRASAAGPRPPASLLGREIRRLPTSRQVVALTFNAAWNERGVASVLTELRRRGHPATFFPTGGFAEARPAAVRAMGAEHGLGNHSHTHPYFDDLSTRERGREVRRADAAIRTAAGTAPLPFFRFPYSSTTTDSVADVNALGYAAIEFTVDTNGYLGPGRGMTVQRVIERAVAALAPGAIIQMHVGSSAADGIVLDAQALPRLLDAIAARGYGVVDLREFLVP
ncbi:polysaccharide deacetylase family protein [Streptomyces aureoverticillatus]|uniref:polysaccharide deacetylase family protein n=1 Tax=Streptomyces aureoverticillatus TaxID=66871 RepID=UPI0013DC8698|nr:polysaccharide deacetylase family protein [Streptomyces aureoverticillatus]QIB48290.1 polysaccharide deacetylase family protein [Streptomyces aureoverticillatus]